MLKVAAALILGLIFTGSSVQKESSAERKGRNREYLLFRRFGRI